MRQEMVIKSKELPEGGNSKNISEFIIDQLSGFACAIDTMVVKDGYVQLRPFNFGDNGRLKLDTLYQIPLDQVDTNLYSLKKGDILFNNTNSIELVGKSLLVDKEYPFAFSNHINRLRVDTNSVVPAYFQYQLRHMWIKEHFALNCKKWIGQAGYTVNKLADQMIFVPSLENQQEIVDKLDKQMAQIEMMKKETKNQLGAVITILESSLSYYLNEKNVFTGTSLQFSEICSLDKKQINPKSNEAMRLMYVGMEDIESNTGKINLNDSIKWDSISSNTFYFNQNHVLYGKLRPYLNKVAEPNFEGRCSTELIPILPKSSCKRDYLVMLLRSSQTIQAAMKNKTGSRMPRADMNEIMKLRVKLPDVSEQEIILQKMKLFTSQLDEIRSTINIQLNAINQLPASILNEVFGQYQINS